MRYPVTRPAIPDFARYSRYVEQANASGTLTNFGPLETELTARLESFLGVENLLIVSNGTIALQVAYRALGVAGRVITTPFSFVATTSTLRWEGLTPVFADIDPFTLNLDPLAAAAVDGPIGAIVPVHVYGNPCDVVALERLGHERGVPVIYDAAHAFGSRYGNRSLLTWGDAATLSFHATKLFHSVEGGAIVFRDRDTRDRAKAICNFGLRDGVIGGLGTNAKMSEYHAAAGLTVLEQVDEILDRRRAAVARYQRELDGLVEFQRWSAEGEPNGAYMPILLADESECLRVQARLADTGVGTRRYFHPSLNQLDAEGQLQPCPVAERTASRVLCLPIYSDISMADVDAIAGLVRTAVCDQRAG